MPIKGFERPQRVHQALGEIGARDKIEAARTRSSPPLVGRDEETALLRERWEQARHGEGQVVLLMGEPGIGKSRMAEAFVEHAALDRPTVLRYFCSPYHHSSAFYPFSAAIEHGAAHCALRCRHGNTKSWKNG